jgi:drug/metabolite transporter (DMT)-like permease
VLTLFWSKLFFNEPITKGKVGAIGVILCGLVCIGLGAQ